MAGNRILGFAGAQCQRGRYSTSCASFASGLAVQLYKISLLHNTALLFHNTLAKLFEKISQPRTTMVLSQSLWCLVSKSKPDLNAAQFLMQLARPSLANRERFTDLAADGAWI